MLYVTRQELRSSDIVEQIESFATQLFSRCDMATISMTAAMDIAAAKRTPFRHPRHVTSHSQPLQTFLKKSLSHSRQTHGDSFRFMALPLELQRMVVQEYFRPRPLLIDMTGSRPACVPWISRSNILLVSKHLHQLSIENDQPLCNGVLRIGDACADDFTSKPEMRTQPRRVQAFHRLLAFLRARVQLEQVTELHIPEAYLLRFPVLLKHFSMLDTLAITCDHHSSLDSQHAPVKASSMEWEAATDLMRRGLWPFAAIRKYIEARQCGHIPVRNCCFVLHPRRNLFTYNFANWFYAFDGYYDHDDEHDACWVY